MHADFRGNPGPRVRLLKPVLPAYHELCFRPRDCRKPGSQSVCNMVVPKFIAFSSKAKRTCQKVPHFAGFPSHRFWNLYTWQFQNPTFGLGKSLQTPLLQDFMARAAKSARVASRALLVGGVAGGSETKTSWTFARSPAQFFQM